jgi:hypothetical protein
MKTATKRHLRTVSHAELLATLEKRRRLGQLVSVLYQSKTGNDARVIVVGNPTRRAKAALKGSPKAPSDLHRTVSDWTRIQSGNEWRTMVHENIIGVSNGSAEYLILNPRRP